MYKDYKDKITLLRMWKLNKLQVCKFVGTNEKNKHAILETAVLKQVTSISKD